MFRQEWQAFLSLLSFMTRFPVWPKTFCLEKAVLYLPFLGVLLGGVFYGGTRLLVFFLDPPLTAFLVLVLIYYLADYFHFDGLLDTADALAAAGDREKKLALLKTPEIGALGFLFGFFFLLGEFLLAQKFLLKGDLAPFFWRPVIGRLTLVLLGLLGRPAKTEGLGTVFFTASKKRLKMALLFGVLPLFLFPGPVILVFLGVYFLNRYFQKIFGGLTGDLLGATLMLSQSLFWWGLLLLGAERPSW